MKKMNKKFVAGTAFALGATAALTGCGLPQPNVYGPAPSDQIETEDEVMPEKDSMIAANEEKETSEGGFTTDTEINDPVYGPPDGFDVIDEVQVQDYGPPEDFDVESEVQPDVYGPPDGFDEEEEIPEILYGPPESDDLDDWD